MTPTETKNAIQTALNTLNLVEVKGRENMNRLLGAMLCLEAMITRIDTSAEEVTLDEVHPAE